MTTSNLPPDSSRFFTLQGSSATAQLIQARDWAATPLGPVAQWPQNLKTAVGIALGSSLPMVVLWGEELIQLYNDAYAHLLSRKHPASLGRPARESWGEVWQTIGPMFEAVLRTGQTVSAENLRLDAYRDGRQVESYFTLSWSPLFGEQGRIEGIFASAVENTEGVLGARRQRLLRELAELPVVDGSVEECLRRSIATLEGNPDDVPFAAAYLCATGGAEACWVAGFGTPGGADAPRVLDLQGESPFDAALYARIPYRVAWPSAGSGSAAAVVLPLIRAAEVVGFLLVGLSTVRPSDEAYQHFLTQLADTVCAALSRVHAFSRAQEERVAVLERMTDGFFAMDRSWRLTYANAAAERFLRLGREQIIGRELWQLFPSSKGSRFDLEFHRAMRQQLPVQFEAPSEIAGVWVEAHAYPSPEGLVVFFQDITERRRAEDAQRRLTEIINATPDFVGMADPEGRTQFVNRAGRRMLGYGKEEDLTGRPISDFSEPDSFESTVLTGIECAVRDGGWRGESTFRHRDGRPVPVSQVILAHRSQDGEVAFLSTIARDTTEQRAAEARLRESEERYRSVFENNPLPMWLYDPVTLAFLEVNAAAEKQYGYSREELLRMSIREIRPPEDVPALQGAVARIEAGQRYMGIFRHRRRDGQVLQVDVTADRLVLRGRVVHLALAHDVTERVQLEAQFRQAQKMEAVGQLAGGIAHDFNNLLAVMGTYSRAALGAVPTGTEVHEDLREVVSAIERAAGLTRQLLAFSRQQPLTIEALDLNPVVQEAERMLRRLLRADIRLVTALAEGLPPVLADRGQLEQVLLNLAVNARDAMPEGGTLSLETALHVVEEGPRAGHYVRLAVRDTGHGMDQDTQRRIFEPFFTTKPVGKGTGLGLPMVYGVLQQLGGHIEVESAPGQGTTFTLLLPPDPEEP